MDRMTMDSRLNEILSIPSILAILSWCLLL